MKFIIIAFIISISTLGRVNSQDIILTDNNILLKVEIDKVSDSLLRYNASIENLSNECIFISENRSDQNYNRANYLGIGFYSESETFISKKEQIELLKISSKQSIHFSGLISYHNKSPFKIVLDYPREMKKTKKIKDVSTIIVEREDYSEDAIQLSTIIYNTCW